jgi:transposase
MTSEFTKVRFDGQDAYIGIDVARRSWKVCIFVGQAFHKRFSAPPDPQALVQHLQKNFPGAIYHSVYEAGYFGFWIHRALSKLGVDSKVINPADVPTTDKERQIKTDRVDAAKLARYLANGSLCAIYIPDRVAEEDRSLVRMRASFVKKQTRTKCQIKAMLRYFGEQLPEDMTDRYWSRAYIGWLESRMFEHATGRVAFQTLVQELLQLRGTIADLTKRIRALSTTDRYRKRVELLLTVPGIRLVSAMTFLTEIVTLERFKDRDRLLSYVGLVPGEHSTGDTEEDTGLIHRRNAALRYILIECAWIAQREDPVLLKAFAEYSSRMPKSMAIVHIARKLVTRMRYVLKHEEPYVTGVLSNGYIQAAQG